MTHAKYAPMDPATEIDRPGIAQLTGIHLTKIVHITLRTRFGFPPSTRPGSQGKKLYSLFAVMAWFEANDLKRMKLTADDRARRKPVNVPNRIDSAEVACLKIGTKPPKFKGHGSTITVHVPERHGYQTPHSQLTRFSHSEADHRSHYVGNGLE